MPLKRNRRRRGTRGWPLGRSDLAGLMLFVAIILLPTFVILRYARQATDPTDAELKAAVARLFEEVDPDRPPTAHVPHVAAEFLKGADGWVIAQRWRRLRRQRGASQSIQVEDQDPSPREDVACSVESHSPDVYGIGGAIRMSKRDLLKLPDDFEGNLRAPLATPPAPAGTAGSRKVAPKPPAKP